jgi:hypothetical protein
MVFLLGQIKRDEAQERVKKTITTAQMNFTRLFGMV